MNNFAPLAAGAVVIGFIAGSIACAADFANPGMLWISRGETLWQKPPGPRANRAPLVTATQRPR